MSLKQASQPKPLEPTLKPLWCAKGFLGEGQRDLKVFSHRRSEVVQGGVLWNKRHLRGQVSRCQPVRVLWRCDLTRLWWQETGESHRESRLSRPIRARNGKNVARADLKGMPARQATVVARLEFGTRAQGVSERRPPGLRRRETPIPINRCGVNRIHARTTAVDQHNLVDELAPDTGLVVDHNQGQVLALAK